jgi:putative MATE family efflux protein
MQTPPEIIKDAYTYIVIIFAGIPTTILYNLLAGIMRSLGDSKTPLIFLAIATILNIFLDLALVLVIPMGVAGAAVATVISQLVSGVLCWIYMKKKYPILKTQKDELGFDFSLSKRLILSGIPMALQFSITAIGSIILQSAVNSLGTICVAAVTAANKVQSFVHLPLSTIGVAMATYCGQNLGAERLDRVKKGVNTGSIITSVYCFSIMLIIFFFGQYISLMFLDQGNTEVLLYVDRFLKINSIFYIPLGLIMVYRNSVQGLEFGVPAMLAGVFELVGRGAVCFGLLDIMGFNAVSIASPVAWIAADILLIPTYYIALHIIKKRLALKAAKA